MKMIYDIVAESTEGRFCIVRREKVGKTGVVFVSDLNDIEAHYLKKKLDENDFYCEDCGKNIDYDEIWYNFGLCLKCMDKKTDEEKDKFAGNRILNGWKPY